MTYEGCRRVGCIVHGPAVPVSKVVDHPVSTLDLAATFCDYANVSAFDNSQSKSLRALIEKDTDSRDRAYSKRHVRSARCGVPLALQTVRSSDARLTLETLTGSAEMYDLKNDPDEMQNLFYGPGYAGPRRQLEQMIAQRPGEVRPELVDGPD